MRCAVCLNTIEGACVPFFDKTRDKTLVRHAKCDQKKYITKEMAEESAKKRGVA